MKARPAQTASRSKIRERFVHWGYLSPYPHRHPSWWSANAFDCFVDSICHSPQVFANYIGRDGYHSLTIQPVIFSDHRAVAYLRNISDQRMQRVTPSDGDIRYVLNRRDLRLWQFNLHLVCNARPGIGPVVGSHETA